MNKYYLILLAICLTLNFNSHSQNRVLVVGNSLLFYNDMPSGLDEIMSINNDSIKVDQLAFGGFSLRNHLDTYHYGKKSINFVKFHRYKNNGMDVDQLLKKYKYNCDIDTINKSTLQLMLEQYKYDYIIIQDHGSNIVNQKFQKYIAAKSLDRLNKILRESKSKDAKLIYFTEYPNKILYKKNYQDTRRSLRKKFYDTITCKKIEPADSIYLINQGHTLIDSTLIINTPIEDIQSYENGLIKLKETGQFEISPSARLFHILKTENKNWKMYRIGGHPSKKTSFMFSCVYFEMITGKSCEELDYNGSLLKKKATIIKSTVHEYLTSNPVN